ncbi:GNAT family N-acetyltransferase [Cupriavidus basilensis]|uniref:GNAT family N-acetyltransferase n=1 Tax=Cupriavidus basilensis TaxID=68895 RepID=A0ABT6AQT3_9BURK|nr:GNAT family N-acetyltransferase [Cupriavidus basilensis]MDF3834948.1 GNAT family N-acetyltransferase [Cupriavidus basilensis]
MGIDTQATLSLLPADQIACHLGELAALLHACVRDGASIGFVQPFTAGDSEAFWTGNVLPAVRGGARLLLVARQGGRIAGSVQLDYDTPPNQPHRAEVRKLLVHPDHRRQGIAQALMAELERLARQRGRSLLTLDTRTGDKAEPLYASLGYVAAGVIPGYCRAPSEDRLDPTTIMYKAL